MREEREEINLPGTPVVSHGLVRRTFADASKRVPVSGVLVGTALTAKVLHVLGGRMSDRSESSSNASTSVAEGVLTKGCVGLDLKKQRIEIS